MCCFVHLVDLSGSSCVSQRWDVSQVMLSHDSAQWHILQPCMTIMCGHALVQQSTARLCESIEMLFRMHVYVRRYIKYVIGPPINESLNQLYDNNRSYPILRQLLWCDITYRGRCAQPTHAVGTW